MSYILDALKKNEAEQDPVAAANLALNEQRRQGRNRLLAICVAGGLLANAAVLGWIFGPRLAHTPPHPDSAVSANPPSRASTTQAVAMATPQEPTWADVPSTATLPSTTHPPSSAGSYAAVPRATEPPARASSPVSTGATTAIASTLAPATPSGARIRLMLGDLPPTVRNRFPGLAISAHIYADDPMLRAIVANGERLEEGDAIGAASVELITEDGVLMAFEGYLVEIPVIASWE